MQFQCMSGRECVEVLYLHVVAAEMSVSIASSLKLNRLTWKHSNSFSGCPHSEALYFVSFISFLQTWMFHSVDTFCSDRRQKDTRGDVLKAITHFLVGVTYTCAYRFWSQNLEMFFKTIFNLDPWHNRVSPLICLPTLPWSYFSLGSKPKLTKKNCPDFMNPTSHRMSFSFCYCHFISTWKLKTLGRKANHLWCLKCGSVSLRVWLWHSSLCPLTSSCLSALCPWLRSWRVQDADRRRSWKSQSLQHSGQWKVGFSGSSESSISQTAIPHSASASQGPRRTAHMGFFWHSFFTEYSGWVLLHLLGHHIILFKIVKNTLISI